MKTYKYPGQAPIKSWLPTHTDQDQKTLQQVQNVAQLPFLFRHVALMADGHPGLGSTIGSVIPTKGAVIPAAVGVDIGCGMMAARTNLHVDDLEAPLADIRAAIEKAVPHGRTDNGGKNDRGAWGKAPLVVANRWTEELESGYNKITNKYPELIKANSWRHLGTLGTGNHFIEICTDAMDTVWIMLHSGSRGIGNKIGTTFIKKAKEECKKWHVDLPDPNLAFLPTGTDLFKNYMEAVQWAQKFAQVNREIMMHLTIEALSKAINQPVISEFGVNCHHNFVQWESHYGENILVTRKGATSARKDQWGIIPGSMGARSYIVQGLGNPESFCSCSHGAGRLMSRTAAKKKFTLEDHAKATNGIECKKDASVLDETPACYKDICAVMNTQKDLVVPRYELRQLVCIKG